MTRTISARRGAAGGLAAAAVAAGVTWSSSGPIDALKVASAAVAGVLLVVAMIAYGSRDGHRPSGPRA